MGFAQGVSWKSVAVKNSSDGAPEMLFFGPAQILFQRRATCAHVSISHEKDQAVAFVVLELHGAQTMVNSSEKGLNSVEEK